MNTESMTVTEEHQAVLTAFEKFTPQMRAEFMDILQTGEYDTDQAIKKLEQFGEKYNLPDSLNKNAA